MWSQLEVTPLHLSSALISTFLIIYAIFSRSIRNRLHLAEPPLALLFGILLGPRVLAVLRFRDWGLDDSTVQECTRMIVGIQCFTVGLELPKHFFYRHYGAVLWFLGPIMAFSWAITSLLAYLVFRTNSATAMIIGACLSPTDPVLAASVLSNSRFSSRVPKRIKNLLSAESACNDGVSFPFLYIGLVAFTSSSTRGAFRDWFVITLLWQCCLGLLVGLLLGTIANRILRLATRNEAISKGCFIAFYLLLAVQSIGIGSLLGTDDFLVAFGAGVGFAHDGWFSKKTRDDMLPNIVDLILNASMFVFFGAIIPWSEFSAQDITPNCDVWHLLAFFILVLLFRRIPIVLALKRYMAEIYTYREALFCGHFGPMGLGALFLVIEARARLETGTSLPLGKPRQANPPFDDREKAIALIWPVICFVVLGSTIVHGLSVAAISLAEHYSRKTGERAPLIARQGERLAGMIHGVGGGESGSEASGSDLGEE